MGSPPLTRNLESPAPIRLGRTLVNKDAAGLLHLVLRTGCHCYAAKNNGLVHFGDE